MEKSKEKNEESHVLFGERQRTIVEERLKHLRMALFKKNSMPHRGWEGLKWQKQMNETEGTIWNEMKVRDGCRNVGKQL